MTKLLSQNTTYLLKPGHDLAFQDANEWSSTLEFYSYELTFLIKLLDKTSLGISRSSEGKEIDKLENEIKQIKEKTLVQIMNKVTSHKGFLSKLEEELFSKKGDEIDFWREHSAVKENALKFFNEVKDIKTKVFKIVENKMRH